MRRLYRFLLLLSIVLVPLAGASRATAAPAPAKLPSIGSTQVVEGFAVTLVSVMRAHSAGLAGYVPGKGNVFLLVKLSIKRQNAHGSYLAQAADFSVQLSNGSVVDGEQFGVKGEWQDRHVYTKQLSGIIGFEVPANDKNLILLWQPYFNRNPDAQAEWLIGTAGKNVADFL